MGSFSIAVGGDVGDHDLSSRRNSFHAALEEGRAHLEELKAQVAGAGDIPDQELNLGMLMSLLCFTKKLCFEVDPSPLLPSPSPCLFSCLGHDAALQ